jgi:hypothetical protein
MRTRSGTRTRNLTTLNRVPLPIGLLGLGANGRPRTGYLRVTNPVHDLLVLRWHRAGGRSRTGRLPITNRALPPREPRRRDRLVHSKSGVLNIEHKPCRSTRLRERNQVLGPVARDHEEEVDLIGAVGSRSALRSASRVPRRAVLAFPQLDRVTTRTLTASGALYLDPLEPLIGFHDQVIRDRLDWHGDGISPAHEPGRRSRWGSPAELLIVLSSAEWCRNGRVDGALHPRLPEEVRGVDPLLLCILAGLPPQGSRSS